MDHIILYNFSVHLPNKVEQLFLLYLLLLMLKKCIYAANVAKADSVYIECSSYFIDIFD